MLLLCSLARSSGPFESRAEGAIAHDIMFSAMRQVSIRHGVRPIVLAYVYKPPHADPSFDDQPCFAMTCSVHDCEFRVPSRPALAAANRPHALQPPTSIHNFCPPLRQLHSLRFKFFKKNLPMTLYP